jgi:hypothetical protein
VHRENDIYIMEAGTAHGVTVGAEFSVYKDKDSSQEASPLGTLIAQEPGAFDTIMSVPEGSKEWSVQEAFALQTKAGAEEALRIHIAKDEKFTHLFDSLFKHAAGKGEQIVHVEERMAELNIKLDRDRVFFEILDNQVTRHGLKRIPHSVKNDVDEVYAVIRAAAHYHWHLRRSNKEKALRHNVQIEFTKLLQTKYSRSPDGPNLIVNGVVDLVVDKNTAYGVKIVNNFERPLYAALFYFSSSSFAISE